MKFLFLITAIFLVLSCEGGSIVTYAKADYEKEETFGCWLRFSGSAETNDLHCLEYCFDENYAYSFSKFQRNGDVEILQYESLWNISGPPPEAYHNLVGIWIDGTGTKMDLYERITITSEVLTFAFHEEWPLYRVSEGQSCGEHFQDIERPEGFLL